MAQIQEVWNKLNPRERLTAWGAIVVGLGWIVGLASYGAGGNTIALLGAIVALVILFLKYSPTQNITWPVPVSSIVLLISGLVVLMALLGLVTFLQVFGIGIGGFFWAAIIASVITAIGAGLMVWGAWQEYQLKLTETSSGASRPTATPPASPPYAPPPSAPATPSSGGADTNDLPPA